eukprot:COSAG02_NODE_52366_length_308_cov_0.746411_1_plen_21_part_01
MPFTTVLGMHSSWDAIVHSFC